MQVYQNCKIYGPYIRKDGRKHCIVIFPDKSRKCISYPKLLMEQKLGRYLTPDETVDHIDGNFSNNNIDNLRILFRSEHVSLDVKRVNKLILICEVCGRSFVLNGRKLQDAYYNRKNKNATGPYCSKRCAGIASHNISAYKTHVIMKNYITRKSLMNENS